ncbi:MAG: hypothetical protein NTV46_11690 [Verrucomicrobia bacterium]|nr:hypothetical protein [Verrucomicrobiota bacterium]
MNARVHPDNHPPKIWLGAGLMVVTCIVLCLGVLLVWFAMLREKPAFWSPAGGYSNRLRDVVAHIYLPLWFANAMVLLGLSRACYSKVGRSIRFSVVALWILGACWGLLATAGMITVSNNILNLIHGQPFHHHGKM